ncbi:3-isopropylmalate dehydrogenase [Erysipelotrichaceae bacterium OttesenSCG-928-M19]|nr:3-isopropylmalate dehydrogenase [Erysipelotrichaceae bacterium OttesenSCG-928-M19]
MNNKVMCLAGDGIGPEIMGQAKRLINYLNQKTTFYIEMIDCDFGGIAIEKGKTAFPSATKEMLDAVDAVLLSAIGDHRYDNEKYTPERALLDLRKELELFINIRPIKTHSKIAHLTSYRKEVIKDIDLIFFRELSSGAYFGKPREINENEAIDTIYYSNEEITRIVKVAFEFCLQEQKKLTSVDKANVLATSKKWRSIVDKIAQDYPDVKYDHHLVDSFALELALNPSQFQVIVTDNLFGDILSDQAASFLGSLGMLASCSHGNRISLYEPGHGSALAIAGKNLANPIAMLKSVAMMYQHSFNQIDIAKKIYDAIDKTLADEIFTIDLNNSNYVMCDEFVDSFLERIDL